jgi:hypothetical protein
MKELKTVDFSKLLGFETVSEQLSECVDFQDEALGAKLGAKVGGVEPISCPAKTTESRD